MISYSLPKDPQLIKLGGVVEGFDAFVLSDLAKQKSILHIVRDEARLRELQNFITFVDPSITVMALPAWDCLPYDRVSPKRDVMAERMQTVHELVSKSHRKHTIVLATVSAALQRLPVMHGQANQFLSIRKGDSLEITAFQDQLISQGYLRVGTVREPGEYAVRGGIIDLYVADQEQPVRIDLFGEEIESISYFDPFTQRTVDTCPSLELSTACELLINEESSTRFRAKYREMFGAEVSKDPLYEAIGEGRQYPGQEHWLPLFYEELTDIFKLCEGFAVTLDFHAQEAVAKRLELIEDYYQTRCLHLRMEDEQSPYRPLPVDALYLTLNDFEKALSERVILRFSPFVEEGSEDLKARGPISFADVHVNPQLNIYEELKKRIQGLQEKHKHILITCSTTGSADRLLTLLQQHGLGDTETVNHWSDISKLSQKHVGLTVLDINHGFAHDALVVLSEQDILGQRLIKTSKKRKSANLFIEEASALTKGDLVVHEEHGLGRFLNLITLDVGNAPHDCVCVVYANDDKIFIPVENLEVLSRYGSEGEFAVLDRLGGSGWQARKARVKQRIREIASELIALAAKRSVKRGRVYNPPAGTYDEFCHRFPYPETDDQLRAIEETLDDLQNGTPMDRLICGDVGFGKTEIALRAAFVVAASGQQVAVIAPTTLLARQHYLNFFERFRGFGIEVAHVSRLVSDKEKTKIRKNLQDNKTRIVVGTHALLSKNIDFADLGLVIIDEEQRFGVAQKERMKELRNEVHVLTLTATPIPRTLQMAMTGVRQMSLITTPPLDRLSVRTFVMPYDSVVIREAIMREHYRGGQTFYVCPRVVDLARVHEQLTKLVPETKVVIAHGQMTGKALEDVMFAFDEGRYDILLATNIIESGIDIPNANTLIIHRADMFGLAQLYQIRGRVGRSKQRGYAYVTVPTNKALTQTATRRLEVLQTLDTLGAGFQLASYDLDIRGAGNILGEEQSGHIKEVGVELYQHMLQEALESLRAEAEGIEAMETSWTPHINVGVPVFLSEDYVPDMNVRLGLYRRLANLTNSEEINSFGAELIDRFGPLPEAVKNLLTVINLKRLAKRAYISKCEAGEKGLVIRFRQDRPPKPDRLLDYITQQSGTAKVRPDQSIFFVRAWRDPQKRLDGMLSILQDLCEQAV
jgi:transcription-repair coupling factor (superfamily II helicase)